MVQLVYVDTNTPANPSLAEASNIIVLDDDFSSIDAMATEAAHGIAIITTAASVIREHGLDTGLVAFLQHDGYLSQIAPNFPSVESLSSYGLGGTAALRAAEYLDAAAENIATSALNGLRKAFATVAEKVGHGIMTLGRWLRILAKRMRTKANAADVKAAVPPQQLKEMDKLIDDANKLVDEMISAAANPTGLAGSIERFNKMLASLATRGSDWIRKIPTLKAKPNGGIAVDMVENQAAAATAAGASSPAVVADAAEKVAARVEKLNIVQMIGRFFSSIGRGISSGVSWVIDLVKAIGRVIYWILNTVTFGALQWMRKKLAPAAAKVAAEAPAAA